MLSATFHWSIGLCLLGIVTSAQAMAKEPSPDFVPLRILVLGAHPDDAEYKAGGTAAKWAKLGHKVKLVSMTNGDIGHWESAGGPLAQRRIAECAAAAEVLGVTSQIIDIHDGELLPTLENRKLITKLIRQWQADIVITHRPWDYHPDHRYVGELVQDCAFMVTVPFFCPDVPALEKNPVFLFTSDRFQKPSPFKPDVAVALDDIFETKIDAIHELASQAYEGGALGNPALAHLGLPSELVKSIPPASDPVGRKAWLKQYWSKRQGDEANKYRDLLKQLYGEEAGSKVQFAETFEICEYGRQPDAEELKRLFPFFE